MILGGWLEDPPKSDDKGFNELRARLPAAKSSSDEHLLPTPTPISHQGRLNTCSANVTADALEILMGVRGEVKQVSRLFIYYNARNYHGSTGKDGGTYLRMAFEGIKRLGVCPEDLWPYVISNVNVKPPLGAYKAANDYQVTGFYRINAEGSARVDAVEAALRADHPVAFGAQVGEDFEAYKGKTDAAFNVPSRSEGRHAMLWCGVRKRGGKREFKVRNSWGEEWGLGGYAWMSEEYVASPTTRDIWVPTIMPSL